MQTLLNTLYIQTPNAYAHLENGTLRLDVEHEKKFQVPLHHLGAVVCFGDTMVSPALIARLAEEGKSLVFLDSHGRFKARIEGPISGNVLLRQAQYEKARDTTHTLDIARACVAGKIRNCRHVLRRSARDSHDTNDEASISRTADELGDHLRQVPLATDLDQLRGLEGDAARRYFSVMQNLVRSDQRKTFAMNGRNRRPPLDPFNALISFLYSMLMNDCRSALETVGLDPQLGFLHALRPGRAALALDLMEEFRPVLADRLALTLINRQQITADDFETRPGGAVNLSSSGRKTVVVAYQERKREEFAHPLLEQQVSIALLPLIQARLLARHLRGDMDGYLPFLAK